MALLTFGSNAQTTLHALVMNSNLAVADGATLRANIKNDLTPNNVWPGGFEFQGGSGLLYVPRRGTLQVLPGDYVAYDSNGWPILVSAEAVATGSQWVHS
jgi:hypothetical protein